MGDHRPVWAASQSVTGYPVATNGNYPPAQPYYYPNAQSPYYSNPNPYSSVFRLLFILLLVAASIILLTLIILWAVLRPRFPGFHLTSLSLNNLEASAIDQQVSGNWVAQFDASNPNKKLKVYYSEADASIWYQNELLSQVRVAPFYLGTTNSTILRVEFLAMKVYLASRTVKKMEDERGRGFIKFDVKFFANAQFKARGFSPRRSGLRVLCRGVRVSSSENSSASGNYSGESMPCAVYLTRKFGTF